MIRRFTTRDDLTAYVDESLSSSDPGIVETINIDAIVDYLHDAGEVEYGVTTEAELEERIPPDTFWKFVENLPPVEA